MSINCSTNMNNTHMNKLLTANNDAFLYQKSHNSIIPNKTSDIYYHIRKGLDDLVCDVCLDSSGYEFDDLIVCCLCNSAVHQSCYGSELDVMPKGNWYCQRCSYLKENKIINPKHVKCTFCPELKGIMKKIGDNIWAHIVCVNWIPEIYFIDQMKQKINYNSLNRERFMLRCTFCKIPDGCCIQCDDNICTVSFHVKCAQKEGLIFHWYSMEKDKSEDFIPVKCLKHKKPNKNPHFMFLQKKREKIVEDKSEEKEININIENKKKTLFKIDKNLPSDRQTNNANNQEFRILSPVKNHKSNLPHTNKRIFKIFKINESTQNNNNPGDQITSINNNSYNNCFLNKQTVFMSDNQNKEKITTQIIPTQINFHNNTFNFGSTYNNKPPEIIFDNTSNIKLNLKNDIIKDKLKLGLNLEEKNNSSKDLMSKESTCNTDKSDDTEKNNNMFIDIVQKKLSDKDLLMKNKDKVIKDNNQKTICLINLEENTEIITNSDYVHNKLLNENKKENKNQLVENHDTIRKIGSTLKTLKNVSQNVESPKNGRINSAKMICEEPKETTKLQKTASQHKVIKKNDTIIMNRNNEYSPLHLKKNNSLINCERKDSRNTTAKSQNPSYKSLSPIIKDFKETKDLNDENRRKLFKNPSQKYIVQKELANILKLSHPVTLTEILNSLTNFFEQHKLLEKKEYVLLFKNNKLKELFNSDFLKLSDVKPKLLQFLQKCDSSNDKKEIKENTTKKHVNEENKSTLNLIKNKIESKEKKCLNKSIKNVEKNEKKSEQSIEDGNKNNNGWKIEMSVKKNEINIKKIHTLEKVKNLNFFIKDESLKLFKF